jgi:transcriptional regulator with XRE-family HTH domain
LRIEAGMTHEDFAKASGLEPPYLGRIEQGNVNVTVSTLGQLAQGLRVEPGVLLGRVKMHRVKKGRPVKRG